MKYLFCLGLGLGSFERDVTVRLNVTFWTCKTRSNLGDAQKHQVNGLAINFHATWTDFFIIAFHENVSLDAFDFAIEYELALNFL